MDLDLAGRTGLVTGASAGIGRGIALALGTEGVRLVVHGRRREALESLAAEIVAAGGPEPTIVTCDLTAPDAVDLLAAAGSGTGSGAGSGAAGSAARAAGGPVSILVNNAGGGRGLGPDATEDAWDEALTVNFSRHRQLTARLVPAMRAAGWGRIVSVTGKNESNKGVNGAHVAKAAMHAWAKGLSRDLGPHGITVNSIAPGKINSDQIMRRYSPEFREREAREEIPVGYYGEPADIAVVVCFLASPLARYVSGAVIPVDGGLRRYMY